MKKNVVWLCLWLLAGTTWAQKAPLTLEDGILRRAELAPERLSQLQWIPGTENLGWADNDMDDPAFVYQSAEENVSKILFFLSQLNVALKAKDLGELKRLPRMEFLDSNTIRFTASRKVLTYDIQAGTVQAGPGYPAGAGSVDRDGEFVGYTIDQNLFISTPKQNEVAVTKEENESIRNGEATHRYEFGISKGIFWSPTHQHVAFYRTDETMVTRYPIMNLRKQPAGPNTVAYPFAGEPSHHTTLGIYDLASGKTHFLETGGDPEHYLTNIAWTPDGKSIYVAELNRDQNALEMKRYDAASGKLDRVLFSEKNDKYIQPLHAPMFVPDAEGEFLWQSARDGFNHLYHYNADGELLGQLTQGDFNVTSIHGFGPKGRYLYVSGTTNQGIGQHLMKVDLKKKTMVVLNEDQPGFHSVQLSPDKSFYLDTYTSRDVPRKISIRSTKDGSQVRELLNALDPYEKFSMGQIKLFQIKAADGETDLWCRMILPPDFDENKKYPVITYVYNGPGVQLIRDVYGAAAAPWMHTAAAKGMIVFTVDGRGSSNRGMKFEQATFRDLGTIEIEDQLEGVKYLKSLPYVDVDRLAIHGWSYGGFMTTSLMTRTPGTYKVGVAGGPVIDWGLYEVMYTERYMDTPESNPEGYEKSRLTNYVDQLEGKLMLIHGTDDDVVVWQNSLMYIDKCVEEGVQLDYFVYPNHAHNVRGKDRIHLLAKILMYIEDNLD